MNKQSKVTLSSLLGLALVLVCPSNLLYASETQRASRLALLRTATGNAGNTSASSSSGAPEASSSNGTSFSDRVDMMLSTSKDVDRSYVQDRYAEPPPVVEPGLTEEELLEKAALVESPKENLRAKIKDASTEDQNELSKPLKQKVESDEVHYQSDIIKKDKKYQDSLKKVSEETPEEKSSEKNVKPKSSLRPSLANNPFYFGEEATAEDFEKDKAVMTSRLVQKGYTRLEVQSMIGAATKPEEVILTLMQQEGFNYGDAAAVVGTFSEQAEE